MGQESRERPGEREAPELSTAFPGRTLAANLCHHVLVAQEVYSAAAAESLDEWPP